VRLGGGWRPTDIDLDVATDGPAQLLQHLQERAEPALKSRVILGRGEKHADPPHPIRLLRVRNKRPSRCAAN
jgi:hypothetical protein